MTLNYILRKLNSNSISFTCSGGEGCTTFQNLGLLICYHKLIDRFCEWIQRYDIMKALRKLNVISNINSFNICVAMVLGATEYNKDWWGANEVITTIYFSQDWRRILHTNICFLLYDFTVLNLTRHFPKLLTFHFRNKESSSEWR